MNALVARRLTGLAGLTTAVALLAQLPLYFVYDGAPPDGNVLTRSLFGIIGLTTFAVFLVGFREIVSTDHPEHGWSARLATTGGLMWALIVFVSIGLETGAVIASAKPIDPTIAVSGTYILYGAIARALETLFLAALAYTVLRTRVLPRWVGGTAAVLAVVNVAFLPSIYFGNVPAHFYAANGWGTTATIGGLFVLWLLPTSIAMLARRRPGPR